MSKKPIEESILEEEKVNKYEILAENDRVREIDAEKFQALEDIAANLAIKKQNEQFFARDSGIYSEIVYEVHFFDITEQIENVICHFYNTSDMRCLIFDKHLQVLASKYGETRFYKINAEKCGFLAKFCGVKDIPTIILCKYGKIVDYIIGFDDLGGVDDFSTEMLEWRIAHATVINYSGDLSVVPYSSRKPIKPFTKYRPRIIH